MLAKNISITVCFFLCALTSVSARYLAQASCCVEFRNDIFDDRYFRYVIVNVAN